MLYFNENNKEVELSCDMTKRTVSGYEIGELTIEFGYKTSEETYYHKGNKFTLEPFKKYEILMHPYIEVDGDTISSIKDSGPLYKEYSFIAIPDCEYKIDMDHGDGETAMALTWNIKFFNPDNNRYEKYSNEDAFSYTIELTPKDSEKGGVSKSIDVAGEGNSCYFKPDNASEAYDEVYWYDGKSIKYVDAVLYDASVIVKAKIDDEEVNIADCKKRNCFFMDKQRFVSDLDNNLYRIEKLGNRVWTLDDLRYKQSYFSLSEFYVSEDGFIIFGFWGKTPIPGYHISTEADWEDLEGFLGIRYPENSRYWPNDVVLERMDWDNPSEEFLNDFSKGCWKVFASPYGWKDDNGEYIDNHMMSIFNAPHIGSSYDDLDIYDRFNGDIALYKVVDSNKVYAHRLISRKYNGIIRLVGETTIHENEFFYISAISSLRYVKD